MVLGFEISDSCSLRSLEESDAEELYGCVDGNRTYLARWVPWAAGQTLEGTLEFIRSCRRQVAENDGFQLTVLRDGGIVGMVGFVSVDWDNRSTSIGYWLSEDQQGQGLITRSVRALVDHAVGVWELNRIEIQASPENRRSRAVPERLGFREEGTLREAERIGDRFLDSVAYSVLAAEWTELGR